MHVAGLHNRRLLAGLLAGLALAACSPDGVSQDATGELPPEPPSDAAPPADLSPEEQAQLAAGWALYTIDVGVHSARVSGGSAGNPLSWFTSVSGRDYNFRFNSSARYVLTHPMQPEDQLDWNKLPGLSDCGTVDLAVNGAMFGWRWRLDTTPKVLEVIAYANNNSKHLWLAMPLFTLDDADLAADAPLRYRVWLDGAQYRFAVSGSVRGRAINVSATLPRACARTSATALKWASGLYFGGTSTAPSKITGYITEVPFVP
jgi:hypothetical protein